MDTSGDFVFSDSDAELSSRYLDDTPVSTRACGRDGGYTPCARDGGLPAAKKNCIDKKNRTLEKNRSLRANNRRTRVASGNPSQGYFPNPTQGYFPNIESDEQGSCRVICSGPTLGYFPNIDTNINKCDKEKRSTKTNVEISALSLSIYSEDSIVTETIDDPADHDSLRSGQYEEIDDEDKENYPRLPQYPPPLPTRGISMTRTSTVMSLQSATQKGIEVHRGSLDGKHPGLIEGAPDLSCIASESELANRMTKSVTSLHLTRVGRQSQDNHRGECTVTI